MKLISSSVLLLVIVEITYQQPSLKKKYSEENLSKIKALRESHGPIISMDSEKFKKYVKTKNKNYSVVVMFTALKPNYKCSICPEAKKEFSIFTTSFHAAFPSSEDVYFVQVDIFNSQEAFQNMGLKHVPAFFYFPGDRKRKKTSDTYDARRMGYSAKGLSVWLSEITDMKVKIVEPTDFSKVFTALAVLFPFVLLTFWKPDFVYRIVGNKLLWGFIVMSAVLVMTSGQMWNHIRKPADANRNSRGGTEYIHGSRSGQYIFESYIVMALNGAITVGFILLNEVNRFKSILTKKAFGFIGLGMIVIFFGLLISIFRLKNRSYPYSFLFL